jgi:predicted SAM-dependent methyltransferase
MNDLKLHLGSGRRRLQGFLNIDREFSEGIDLVCDVSKLDDFRDESVVEIYTSHTLEYFDRKQAAVTLAEWFRVLKPGGQIYVSVPDFDSLVQVYSQTGRIETILGPLFGMWHNTNEKQTHYHKTVWDFASLTQQLEVVGFEEVSRFNPIEHLTAIDPLFDDYSLAFFPHMDRAGIQISLCIRGAKPS